MDEEQKKINYYREQIDDIDVKIVKLLNKRAEYANSIGSIKRKANMSIYIPDREEQVISNVKAINPGPLNADAIARLYERIIDVSRCLEHENLEHEQSRERNKDD